MKVCLTFIVTLVPNSTLAMYEGKGVNNQREGYTKNSRECEGVSVKR